MARKRKYRERTEVLSVRLPVSLIDKLDALCRSLRTGRAEFFVMVLRRYPKLPSPERARVWLANLLWLLVGGGMATLVASFGGSATLSNRIAPARSPTQMPLQLESEGPLRSQPGALPPGLPRVDIRLDRAWRPGDLQRFIPRQSGAASASQDRRSQRGQRAVRQEQGKTQ